MRIAAITLASLTLAFASAAGAQSGEDLLKKNGCTDKPGSCPRPIIIVGAGGASRAGFFTASVIGKLLDEASQHSSQGAPLDAAKIRNRIFAIAAGAKSKPAEAAASGAE